MERIPNGKYTKEFREEAVKRVTVKGHSIDDAAKRPAKGLTKLSPTMARTYQVSPKRLLLDLKSTG